MTRKEIVEQADVRAVAEAIGVPIKMHGGKAQIICPGHQKHAGHPDGNFGNCMLFGHGYYCFAGGNYTDVIQMVQEQSELNGRRMSANEAVKFVCDVNGFVYTPDKKSGPTFPFISEELKLIGYKKSDAKKEEINYSFLPENVNGKMIRTIQNSKTIKTEPVSLYQFFVKYPDQCLDMLEEKVNTEITKTEAILRHITNNPMFLIDNGFPKNADAVAFYENIKMHLTKLQDFKKHIHFKKKERKNICC